jgi:hypothetical protein
VRGWFQEKMGEADFTLTDQGGTLVGKTAEEKPFRTSAERVLVMAICPENRIGCHLYNAPVIREQGRFRAG